MTKVLYRVPPSCPSDRPRCCREAEYWTDEFDVGREQLKNAVNAVSNSASAVNKHFQSRITDTQHQRISLPPLMPHCPLRGRSKYFDLDNTLRYSPTIAMEIAVFVAPGLESK